MKCFQFMQEVNIVWFKRDLRLKDHEPLKKAIEQGLPIVMVYFFEPDLVAAPQSDERHWRFVYQSLEDMNKRLLLFDTKVHFYFADPVNFFDQILKYYRVKTVFSHIETGIKVTFDRDVRMKKFFDQHQIIWKEFAQQGVLRRRKTRKNWSQDWYAMMSEKVKDPEMNKGRFYTLPKSFEEELKQSQIPESWTTLNPLMQKGGESTAYKYFESFFVDRAKNYNKHISKPELSRKGCSRLSPYLAWGNLSIRQVYQAAEERKKEGFQKRNLTNFQSRLRWHCHFIQKFEMECRMEKEHVNRGFDLMEKPLDQQKVSAWEEGRTGYPLVDACIRCLKETGYLNFRMRAMVVSFLTHHLFQDWRVGKDFLARQFLDFEPGIHYPQLQMQAGVTGINTVRIYNPVKQSEDHDVDGVFIKKWVPELAKVPTSFLHEPWKITAIEQEMMGFRLGADYPFPIVNLEQSGKYARDQIWKAQKHPAVIEEANRVLNFHTVPNRWP